MVDEGGVRFLGHALLKRMLDCFLSKRIYWSVRGTTSESCEGCELSKKRPLQLIRDMMGLYGACMCLLCHSVSTCSLHALQSREKGTL